MRETQKTILNIIKREGAATVQSIAQELNLSVVTVRHHLYALMADDLIERKAIRRGVGRPQHGYTLTPAGERRYPTRYHVLSAHLISVLKAKRPPEDVERIMESIIRQLLMLPQNVDGLTPPDRLRRLAHHLREQDIPVELEIFEQEGKAHMAFSCPYHYVSRQHPELCSIDKRVLQDTIQLPMVRTGCLLHGDKSCTFSITLTEDDMATLTES